MLRVEIHTSILNPDDPIEKALRRFHIRPTDVHSARLYRRSLDARPKRPTVFVDLIDLELSDEAAYARKIKNARIVQPFHYVLPEAGAHRLAHRPLIIGFGPAGMAAALALSKKGYRPLVLERGPSIQERKEAVRAFWEGGKIDPEANVQFGEGGAGAFSDGKLTTRIKDPRVSLVLEALINAGADRSIAWTHHPHIGTDALVGINENLRHTVEKLGGEIRFRSRVDDLLIQNGSVCGVRLSSGEEIPAEVVILAIGHSARDTMRMLAAKPALTMEPKNFAVGVRVEHLQTFINHRQYRYTTDFEKLPAAEYHLAHTAANGKGVYSFCMCPGGYVVDGASASHTIVTNGMSYADRAGRQANSAIVVQVGPADFGEDLFGGINFQEELERKAWLLGNGKAPVQRITHFLNPAANPLPEDVIPTFPRQTEPADMHALFNGSVLEALEEFFRYTETVWPGFASGSGIMTGVETRTSSPLRILRHPHTLEASLSGLWPAGEGAGFAGGIVSSAIDGLKCAEEIIRRYQTNSGI